MSDLYARMDAIISEYAGDKVADVMAEASRQMRAANARLEALEKAAAPFVAIVADLHEDDWPDACNLDLLAPMEDDVVLATFDVGDLRALARAAGGEE